MITKEGEGASKVASEAAWKASEGAEGLGRSWKGIRELGGPLTKLTGTGTGRSQNRAIPHTWWNLQVIVPTVSLPQKFYRLTRIIRCAAILHTHVLASENYWADFNEILHECLLDDYSSDSRGVI